MPFALTPGIAFLAVWGVWALSWGIAALWTTRTVGRPGRPLERVLYVVVMLVGGILMYYRTSEALHADRLWHIGYGGAYALVGVAALGFVFAWWARIHLGKLWSGTVTLKEGHHVVDTGPYRIVRHPIYTGFIVAILATAAALATWPALLGAPILILGICFKARLEERFLTAELGEAYGNYRKRVPMLVPFWPAS